MTGRAVLAQPDTPLPDWTVESRFVEETLRPLVGAPRGNVPRRALLWCAALSHHARPLPAELAPLPVDQAVDDLVGFFKRTATMDVLALHEAPDEMRRTHAKVFRLLDAFWPVVLDRPAGVQQQAEVALQLRFHIKSERFRVLDEPAYAAGLLARWHERWRGRWLAPLLMPPRGLPNDNAEMAQMWVQAMDGLEREFMSGPVADSTALKYWATLADYAVNDFVKAGLLAKGQALVARLERLAVRHAAAVAAMPDTASTFTQARDAMRTRLAKASAAPLPAGSSTSILGASDDPTPRRDRPGQQEVR